MRMRAIEPSVRNKGNWFALASAVLLCASTSSSVAQSTLPNPVLNSIYPCAAQTGTSIEVTLAGTELAGATKHLSNPAKVAWCKSVVALYQRERALRVSSPLV